MQEYRLNATKHGIRANTAILPWESSCDFNELQDSLYAEYKPSTPTQTELVNKLIWIFWRQRRVISAENSILKSAAEKELSKGHSREITVYNYNDGFDTLSRYDAHLSRRLNRTLSLLVQLKNMENKIPVLEHETP